MSDFWRPSNWEELVDKIFEDCLANFNDQTYESMLIEHSFNAILDVVIERINFILSDEDIISDGFGSEWSSICPACGFKTICVVRPGKVQCNFCHSDDESIPDSLF